MFDQLSQYHDCKVIIKIFQNRLLLGESVGILESYDENTYRVAQLNNRHFGFYIDKKNTIESIILPRDSETPIIYYYL